MIREIEGRVQGVSWIRPPLLFFVGGGGGHQNFILKRLKRRVCAF